MADYPLSMPASVPLPATIVRAAAVPPIVTTTPAVAAPVVHGADQFSPENTLRLRDALRQQGEVRAEVVARARRLAADPAYPPADLAERIAALFVVPSTSRGPVDPAFSP